MSRVNRFGSKYNAVVLVLLVLVLSGSLVSAFSSFSEKKTETPLPTGFFFGVTAGGNVTETLTLIDKVKDYTNFITFTNLAVTENLTRLEEVADYAVSRGLSFLVYTIYPSPYAVNFTFNPITWISEAKTRYGERFLGYYLWDEPGGNQLDLGSFQQFDNRTGIHDYRDAANTYTYYLYVQMRDFMKTNKLFTSDYGLYWYDYEAGYDVVLTQFGWNNSRAMDIALCRGAAEMHNRTWGAMITWTYTEAPYMESAPELYQDMVTAYDAGAKYVVVFNYPQTGPNGLLDETHFDAVKAFKDYVLKNPQNKTSNEERFAYVIPDNYGWGFRKPTDTIWGIWGPDTNSTPIWANVTSLIQLYGNNFDIIYGSPLTFFFAKYHYDKLTWYSKPKIR